MKNVSLIFGNIHELLLIEIPKEKLKNVINDYMIIKYRSNYQNGKFACKKF